MTRDSRITAENQETVQEKIASRSGLAVIVVAGENSAVVSKANNNSICEILYSSAEFAPRCAEFCGKACQQAANAGEIISVKCHAGLNYEVVPLGNSNGKQFAAIVGRVFLKSEDYRIAAERAMSGDWQKFSSEELFKNVLLASSARDIEKASKRLKKLSCEEKNLIFGEEILLAEKNQEPEIIVTANEPEIAPEPAPVNEISKLIEDFHRSNLSPAIVEKVASQKPPKPQKNEEYAAWRALFASLLELKYQDACLAILNFLGTHYELQDLAWLERSGDKLEAVFANGVFAEQEIQISISAEDARLIEAVQKENPLEFRERQTGKNGGQMINLFPIAVGDKIRRGLVVGDDLSAENKKKRIARFVQNLSTELEILRLREEIEQQSRTTGAVQKLNETLKNIDNEDFWTMLAQVSAELMRAERGSLLFFDDKTKSFTVKAAVGNRADIIKQEKSEDLGESVARKTLNGGQPIVIKNIKTSAFSPAPLNREYKTNSFISYPIIIGGRRIGVLNITDKIDGGSYDERDLELLHTFTPQIAVALDRTSLQRKAGEFEQLSLTDSLTGLVNRRYLEERMAEEISRSQRSGYPLGFMMIDVDEFKSYNDNFSHPEGDKALHLVGQALKATLRGADVAARYGGEEFSILLPQTTLQESLVIAERVRQKVESTEFPNRAVTVSIGVATCSAELCEAKSLMAAADKALYEAKSKGKNNVQIFQPKHLLNEPIETE